MTYRELRREINGFSEDQLDMDVAIWQDNDEFFAALLYFAGNNHLDRLEAGHPFLANHYYEPAEKFLELKR